MVIYSDIVCREVQNRVAAKRFWLKTFT